MPDNSKWRKIAVVVRVPVRGKYSERDLRWAVDQLVTGPSLRQKLRPGEQRTAMGRVEVLEMNKVVAAQRRKSRRSLTTDQTTKLSRLVASFLDDGGPEL